MSFPSRKRYDNSSGKGRELNAFLISVFLYFAGVLTDIVKDAVILVSPFKSSDTLTSNMSSAVELCDYYSNELDNLPPPPALLLPNTSNILDDATSALELNDFMNERVENNARDHHDDLRSVKYSKELDNYLNSYVTTIISTHGKGGSLPLRVILELFVSPALNSVTSLAFKAETQPESDWWNSSLDKVS